MCVQGYYEAYEELNLFSDQYGKQSHYNTYFSPISCIHKYCTIRCFNRDYDVLFSGLVVIKCDNLRACSTNMNRLVSFSEKITLILKKRN